MRLGSEQRGDRGMEVWALRKCSVDVKGNE